MEMTDNEILASWRQASDRKKQIPILAELNCCSTMEIERRLRQQGAEIPHRGRPGSKLDVVRAQELYAQGLNDLEMSEMLGVSKYTVKYWRTACGLTSHNRIGRAQKAAAAVEAEHKKEKELEAVKETEQDAPMAATVPAEDLPEPDGEQNLTLLQATMILRSLLDVDSGALLLVGGKPAGLVIASRGDGHLAVDLRPVS